MTRQRLWIRWLEVLGAVFVVLGLTMAIAGGTVLCAPLRRLVDETFWGPDGPSPDAQDFQLFVYALLGAVMVGWGVAIFALARFGLANGLGWAWWTLVIGAGAWYVLDTGASVMAGAWFNVVGNTAILVGAAIPLIGLRDLRRG